MDILDFCAELEADIKAAYEGGVTMPVAEALAAKFLSGSLSVGNELEVADLDARMRRAGLKSLKGAVYLAECSKSDKKPSDKMLEAMIDSDKLVLESQEAFDTAEVYVNKLKNYLNVFHEAHVFMRTVAKGSYEG